MGHRVRVRGETDAARVLPEKWEPGHGEAVPHEVR